MLQNRTKRGILSLFCACVLLVAALLLPLSQAEAVSQAELDRLKAEAENISSQQSELQASLAAVEADAAGKRAKLELLQQQLELTRSEMDNTKEQIATYNEMIADKELELEFAKQEESIQNERLRVRMRTMEENGSISYFSILFQANSFSELLGLIDIIGEVMDYDNTLLRNLEDAREQVALAKLNLENDVRAQEELYAQLSGMEVELSAQEAEIQAVLDELLASAAGYEDELAALNSTKAELDGKISNMAAELERIRQEQANNNNSNSNSGNKNNGTVNIPQPDPDYAGEVGNGKSTEAGLAIVNTAMKYLGVPYVYGGTSPSCFDCSGLVYYVYKENGYSITRRASLQWNDGYSVTKAELQPGDLVFFSSNYSSSIEHVGIYIGNAQFIHASSGGGCVKINNLSDSYYLRNYYGACRVLG